MSLDVMGVRRRYRKGDYNSASGARKGTERRE
jgi:hypothetical protein